jgi:predicted amidohydrolase YtcJ
MNTFCRSLLLAILLTLPTGPARAADADLILHHSKIVTVDKDFTVHQAVAIKGGRILRVGPDAVVLQTRGPRTEVVDLGGKTVLPGLIDSHTHPNAACMTEFDHPIPDMETIQDVLDYIHKRAQTLARGEWVEVHQVFITRLREQRYPTRAELDRAAPHNPVLFATGPDASLNSLALERSGIDRNFKVTDGGAGYAEKDPQTGELTGILRNCTRYVKSQPAGRQPTEADHLDRLRQLFKDYNANGITAIADRDASTAAIDRYRKLRDGGQLSVRIAISHHVDTLGDIDQIRAAIRKVARDPLRRPDPMLRIVGIKTFLDGGMLTGSAYMREPWGVSKIYGITDPTYRGLLFIPKHKLTALVQSTVDAGLQFTAHSVGDGAVHTLLEAYQEVKDKARLRESRSCITHSNFMSRQAVEQVQKLGVVVDLQPAWLYLDTRTLVAQFGYQRLRYFQPLRSLFAAGVVAGGGSDHMQKIGALRAINPYHPFLGMWVTLTRRAKGYDGALYPEEALDREQALRFYTINNARILFLDDQVGSLEEGKRADLIVVDRDLLTCPADAIKETRVLATYLDGKRIYDGSRP